MIARIRCTGARQIATGLNELHRRNGKVIYFPEFSTYRIQIKIIYSVGVGDFNVHRHWHGSSCSVHSRLNSGGNIFCIVFLSTRLGLWNKLSDICNCRFSTCILYFTVIPRTIRQGDTRQPATSITTNFGFLAFKLLLAVAPKFHGRRPRH